MKKYISIILAVLVLAGAFAISKSMKNRKKPRQQAREISLPLAMVQAVKNTNMPVIITATGSLTAKNKIKLYSEVQGVLEYSSNEFKQGVSFKKGEVLYKLNSDEFYTNLLAQKSSFQNLITSMMPDLRLDFKDSYDQWQKYLTDFDIKNSLKPMPEPKSDTEKRFVAAKNIYTNYYNIKNLEIKLSKYTITAPFNGVLTEAFVTPGSLVSPGQQLGEFVDPTVYEMEVSVNSAMVSKLKVGDKVEVQNLENEEKSFSGIINRINQKVDLSSQTINVFIELTGHSLKEGMYLKAHLQTQLMENIMEIPRNLLINQNQVYTVKDSLLQLASIQMVHQNEQTVLVRGLSNNQLILSKPIPKAFDGMKVKIYQE